MRRCPLIALIVLMLFGSTAWPTLCAPSNADCCRSNGACPMRMMQAGHCHDHHDAKSAVVHSERATMIAPLSLPLPGMDETSFAVNDMQQLAGIEHTLDRPPRIDSPSR